MPEGRMRGRYTSERAALFYGVPECLMATPNIAQPALTRFAFANHPLPKERG